MPIALKNRSLRAELLNWQLTKLRAHEVCSDCYFSMNQRTNVEPVRLKGPLRVRPEETIRAKGKAAAHIHNCSCLQM